MICFLSSPPPGVFPPLIVRVHFAQQLPHRAALQFELSLWGSTLSDGERERGGGRITARLLIRTRVFPSFFLARTELIMNLLQKLHATYNTFFYSYFCHDMSFPHGHAAACSASRLRFVFMKHASGCKSSRNST